MAVLLRVAAFFLKWIGFLLTPFLILFSPHKKVQIPPIKNDLLNISVVDLAQKIRKKEVIIRTRTIYTYQFEGTKIDFRINLNLEFVSLKMYE